MFSSFLPEADERIELINEKFYRLFHRIPFVDRTSRKFVGKIAEPEFRTIRIIPAGTL